MAGPTDTIVALSSPPGASERAVVRLSGPRAWSLAAGVFSPPPRRAGTCVAGALRLPGWPPADAQALTFRGPRSYTGEDVVELWVPGAPPLVRRLLLVLTEAGARLADRGEFTRRAYLNDRLDLTQAEAVLALTTSEDRRATRSALRALAGGLRQRIDAVKSDLLSVRAHVEAAIDFSEEELDLVPDGALAARLDRLAAGLEGLLASEGRRPAAGTQPVVALRGPANAGKSTLFNALVGREQAITSPAAGTTRDVIEGEWRLPSGRRVRLLDTAGDTDTARETQDVRLLDAQATAGAQDAGDQADVVLWVTPADSEGRGASKAGAGSSPALGSKAGPGLAPARALSVTSKADLCSAPGVGLAVSARTGAGLADLARALDERLAQRAAATELHGTARQEGLLRDAREALARAASMLRCGDPARAELAAVDLAEALDLLGRLTGELTTDDLLGEIFGAFCIGK